MLRCTSTLLSGGLKPFHDWNLREPLLQKYDGWRILDNPKMSKMECWVTDIGGFVRHLDPIIDDPRLTHQQRVCRLYRWALKELKMYVTMENAYKFNLAYKVVRNKFEKYRYVTDAAMCDMMVRETQKYLRETCSTPVWYRYNASGKDGVLYHATPTYYPDNSQNYDHWTQVETMWYDDAKLHRYHSHHPMNAGGGPMHERFGEWRETRMWWRKFNLPLGYALICYELFYNLGGFYDYISPEYDDWCAETCRRYNPCLRQAIEAEERNQRAHNASSTFGHNWDLIMGFVSQKDGYIVAMQRFRVPGGQTTVDPPPL